jgi:hypothetical protein
MVFLRAASLQQKFWTTREGSVKARVKTIMVRRWNRDNDGKR